MTSLLYDVLEKGKSCLYMHENYAEKLRFSMKCIALARAAAVTLCKSLFAKFHYMQNSAEIRLAS